MIDWQLASSGAVLLLALPFALQAGTMMVDEFYFHRERGLPLWERIGHPLDTLTVVICYGFLLLSEPGRPALFVFTALALFSILFTAKDEPIHAKLCRAAEHRIHILLFALHPLVLGAACLFWWVGTPASRLLLLAQGLLTALFMIYQALFWNFPPRSRGLVHAAGKGGNQ